jgi:hypothetical protein
LKVSWHVQPQNANLFQFVIFDFFLFKSFFSQFRHLENLLLYWYFVWRWRLKQIDFLKSIFELRNVFFLPLQTLSFFIRESSLNDVTPSYYKSDTVENIYFLPLQTFAFCIKELSLYDVTPSYFKSDKVRSNYRPVIREVTKYNGQSLSYWMFHQFRQAKFVNCG